MTATPSAEVEVALDLSELPVSAMGPRSLLWWGTFGFMLIEGMGFLLAAGAYLYLRGQAGEWPPAGHRPPAHWAGALFTLIALASVAPNLWVARQARRKNALGVRWGLVAMTLIALGLTVVRGFEFTQLNVRWHDDAYGSALWLLMVLHTTHLLTDLGDTVVLATWLFTHETGDDQFSDVDDNAGYWNFVVVAWLPMYLLVYWGARLL
ncbi:heme-copper oxidase subunit III [Phenylobacterium sp.]|jgi:heme/copper-type cytochrome/quinol oxidase subunit 3|uniref:heme-copper oxidase subunit III n=1 Tax=Phenylobacterium sp. TaxID=1871053 RepID=UPI0037842004